jgi:hypothetical protein
VAAGRRTTPVSVLTETLEGRDGRGSSDRPGVESAVAGGLLGLLRLRQWHPERIDKASVDQLAEASLRMLGVPASEAARIAALDLPGIDDW